MAWEDIEWSCGHETRKQLYGPYKDRERFIEWAEDSGLCPDCYKELRRAEDEAAGPAVYARRTDAGVEMVCWRQSYPIKAELKARGWRFGEVYPPTANLFGSLSGGVKGWSIRLQDPDRIAQEVAFVADRGWEFRVQDGMSVLAASLIEGRPDLVSALQGE